MEAHAITVTALDHLVLRTPDVERALAFYTGTLGLAPERVEEWRAGKVGFPSVRVSPDTVIDLFKVEDAPGEGSLDHFCLVVEPLNWDAAIAAGLVVVAGPGPRWGARGVGTSVDIEDPDGNTIELRYY